VNGSMNSLKRCRYGAIYADPPWSFRNWSAKGTGRNAVSHYDCLNFEALAALPVAHLAADNCALFLWAVDPLLDKAFELIRAWGFEYKTVGFYYNKSDGFFTGLGYWTNAARLRRDARGRDGLRQELAAGMTAATCA
jgi:N6-adenosine-specific RNA methylase IME4